MTNTMLSSEGCSGATGSSKLPSLVLQPWGFSWKSSVSPANRFPRASSAPHQAHLKSSHEPRYDLYILAKNTTKKYGPAKSTNELRRVGLKRMSRPAHCWKPVREDGLIKPRGFGRRVETPKWRLTDFKNQTPLTRPRHGTLGARQLAP